MDETPPRDPSRYGASGRGWKLGGRADPNGNRAQRRAYERGRPKVEQRQARVVAEKSHMWDDATGICVLHNAQCERRP